MSNLGPAEITAPQPGAAPSPPLEPLLILFGSQTGSAEGLAKRAAKEAASRGFAPRVLALNDCEQAALAHGGKAVVISRTMAMATRPTTPSTSGPGSTRTRRRAWRNCNLPCSGLATRTTRTFAAPRRDSTPASKPWARDVSLAASATRTMKPPRDNGSTRYGKTSCVARGLPRI